MMHDDDPSDEEQRALFRQAMRDVVPLKPSPRAQPAKRRSRGRARVALDEPAGMLAQIAAPGADLYAVQAGDELVFRRTGVSETVLRRLRRGQFRVEVEIDLHGMVVAQAIAVLGECLLDARSSGLRCMRVIHGKGLRSGNRGPVLKNTVNALLRHCDWVMAFVSAPPEAGGTGATLVLLNRV
jgi:DNA-nicking Smr family endonuclease